MIRIVFFLFLLFSILLLCFFRRKELCVSPLKSLIIGILIFASGIGGTFVLGFIETGAWGAISYYGSVFAVPLVMLPLFRVFKVSYFDLMDYCTPCGCIAITVGKLFCLIQGCCGGRVIGYMNNGSPIFFPSQIVEMIFGASLLVLFLAFERKGQLKRIRYPVFMIIYGTGRFILNYFRDTKAWLGVLPSGNIWSLIAIVVGAFWTVNGSFDRSKKSRYV